LNIFEAIFIGFIQGITEFLPISSSGHIVILSDIFNITTPSLTTDLVAHLGSLFAVLIFFGNKGFKKINESGFEYNEINKLFARLIIASIPIGVIGYFMKSILDTSARTSIFVGASFIFSGLFLIFASYINHMVKDKNKIDGVGKVILIGLFQSFAVLPGVSRSGVTISSALLLGVQKKAAVEFSFVLSIPVIFGANLFQAYEIIRSSVEAPQWTNIISVFLVSLIISLLTINFTIKLAQRIKFWVFGVYGVIFGLFSLIVHLF